MDQKEAMDILIKLIEKYKLEEKEKEAVMIAVGILSWTSLAKNSIKAMKENKEKRNS